MHSPCESSGTQVLKEPRSEKLPTVIELPNTTSTTEIEYTSQGYSGTIPTEYGLLTDLITCALAMNELTGAIPTGECV